jgi:hypothetical protein
MMYALCALVGAFLFGAGYWLGKRESPQKLPEQVTNIQIERDDVTDKYSDINQQLLEMLNYTGRARK